MNISARLGGGKSGDPSLYIDILDRKRGMLFDCGLNNFKHSQFRKITDLFVSHAHIDHFIGFDTLLRLNLSEVKTLRVYGPPGILQNVSGKLHGYTWNICDNLQLTIIVDEVLPDRIISTTLESCRGFAVTKTEECCHSNVLMDSGEFSVSYLQLNHKTASFGYSFLEADSFNVQKEIMDALGLEPGPWVAALKQQAGDPSAQDAGLHIGSKIYTVKSLSDQLLIRKKGLKITYLTDFLFQEQDVENIRDFAWKSDLLFCESAFLEKDREKALSTYHLTAKEAGMIARISDVNHLVLFHFSRRYQEYSLLLEEAGKEFSSVE